MSKNIVPNNIASHNLPTSFDINNEEKDPTDNDRAITVEKTKLLLHDLFEVIGFTKVGLGLNDKWEKGKTDKWGFGLPNMVQIEPMITMTSTIKHTLNYPEAGPYTIGWPAHWRVVEHYLGGGAGSTNYYQGNKNIPDFLIGLYTKENWEEEYNTRLNDALLKAMVEGDNL